MWQLPTVDKIGPGQFADLFRSTPMATLGQLVNASIVAFALHTVTDLYVIVGWWLINLAMCSWTMWRWYKNRHRVITKISNKAVTRAAWSGFLYALPWSLLIIIYLGNIPHLEELIMGIAVVGMAAAGSIQLARVYPAAIAYLAAIFVPVIVKCIALGEVQYYLLAGLSVSYTVYLISIVASSANTSVERSSALIDLEKKVVELDQANDALEKLATVDDLTGLPNRRVFHELLAGAIEEASEAGQSMSLMVCDLDHFKNVNDMSGHAAGDDLLREISRRLENSVESNDIVARLGGDEFAIIVKNQQMRDDAKQFIQQLMDQVNCPVEIEGTCVNPGISIGVSIFPYDAKNSKSLLSHADLALQRGKNISRGQYWFFDDNLRSKLSSDAALEEELRLALLDDQFEMFYQPKVDINTGQLRGLESLLRWRRPNGELVAPGGFFSVAEQTGLMPYISDIVIEQIIDDLGTWKDMGIDPGEVAVNIHPVQIRDSHRMQQLARDVELCDIRPEKIVLEITEECVVGRGTDDVPDILKYMRYCGFKISLDDFGTGYASLTHLKTLPVDEIKIDRSFINDLNSDLADRSIVQAMIKLTRSLGLATVAEGVENKEQHNILLAMGCETGQGYLYSRPMDLEMATDYLKSTMKADIENLTIITPTVEFPDEDVEWEKYDYLDDTEYNTL